MEISKKLLEQTAFNRRPGIEERMLTGQNISIHEDNLSEPLHFNTKQHKIAITFLSSYNGIPIDTTKM